MCARDHCGNFPRDRQNCERDYFCGSRDRFCVCHPRRSTRNCRIAGDGVSGDRIFGGSAGTGADDRDGFYAGAGKSICQSRPDEPCQRENRRIFDSLSASGKVVPGLYQV